MYRYAAYEMLQRMRSQRSIAVLNDEDPGKAGMKRAMLRTMWGLFCFEKSVINYIFSIQPIYMTLVSFPRLFATVCYVIPLVFFFKDIRKSLRRLVSSMHLLIGTNTVSHHSYIFSYPYFPCPPFLVLFTISSRSRSTGEHRYPR